MSAVSLIVQVFIFMMLSIKPISCFCFFVLCEIHITLSVLFSSILHSCFAPFFFFFLAMQTHYVILLCSFKDQLQQHVRVHAMEAVMACWELEQSLQSLTGT